MKVLLLLFTLLPLAVSAADLKVPIGKTIKIQCERPTAYIDDEPIPAGAAVEVRFYHYMDGGQPGILPYHKDLTGCSSEFIVTQKGRQHITATAFEEGRGESDYVTPVPFEAIPDPTSLPSAPTGITITILGQ